MPVDDTDDKVRRNLVVFSALIVASAWLGHPELWLVTKLLTPEAAPPPAWKVSSLALAVLIYLFARYWFSAAHMNAQATMHDEWYKNTVSIHHQILINSLKSYHKTKRQPSFIKTNLAEYAREEASIRDVSSDEKFELRFLSVQISQNSEWDGELHTTREFISRTRGGRSNGGNTIAYNFPERTRQIIKARATFRQVIFSKTAAEYFTPLALSAIAACTLLARTISNLLNS